MRRLMWTFASLSFLFAGALNADDKKDQDRFQGTWKVVSVVSSGKERPAESVKDLRVTFKDDTYTLKGGKGFTGADGGNFKLDASKKPGAIDLIPNDGPNKGKSFPGIYEIDGDNFKACYDSNGKERPKEFSSKADSGHVLITYKREK